MKKSAFIQSLIGTLVLGTGFLIYQNIGLKNQNNYLFNEHINLGKEYIDLSGRHRNLKIRKLQILQR